MEIKSRLFSIYKLDEVTIYLSSVLSYQNYWKSGVSLSIFMKLNAKMLHDSVIENHCIFLVCVTVSLKGQVLNTEYGTCFLFNIRTAETLSTIYYTRQYSTKSYNM